MAATCKGILKKLGVESRGDAFHKWSPFLLPGMTLEGLGVTWGLRWRTHPFALVTRPRVHIFSPAYIDVYMHWSNFLPTWYCDDF
jgi:hypothetical protein